MFGPPSCGLNTKHSPAQPQSHCRVLHGKICSFCPAQGTLRAPAGCIRCQTWVHSPNQGDTRAPQGAGCAGRVRDEGMAHPWQSLGPLREQAGTGREDRATQPGPQERKDPCVSRGVLGVRHAGDVPSQRPLRNQRPQGTVEECLQSAGRWFRTPQLNGNPPPPPPQAPRHRQLITGEAAPALTPGDQIGAPPRWSTQVSSRLRGSLLPRTSTRYPPALDVHMGQLSCPTYICTRSGLEYDV